jgi:hypothetical protein
MLSSGTTRRSIIKTGAKLAYAAPIIAATMKLDTAGALAAVSGEPVGFELCTGIITGGHMQLEASSTYKITHNGTGASTTFTTGAETWQAWIDLYAYSCKGADGTQYFVEDIGYPEVTFNVYSSSKPTAGCERIEACFTLEKL